MTISGPVKPPGKRVIKRMSTRTKWLLLSVVSLLVIGAGLCIFSEAAHLKHSGQPTGQWVLLGTYSLILINGGLCLLGQAIRFRVMMDTRRIVRREIKKKARELRPKRKSPSGA
ncbi:hypothetical protein [Rudanella lutea]|uniref:hypothetical protein n=1 Tax=Rudanella lutea TaxID=451374 RepID=UPI000362C890|nr:hypothetical protein [Rudanella lutea]